MIRKYIVTLKQATVKPDGTQVLAVYGTITTLTDGMDSMLIGGRFRIYRSDLYSIVEHDSFVNKELIWVL